MKSLTNISNHQDFDDCNPISTNESHIPRIFCKFNLYVCIPSSRGHCVFYNWLVQFRFRTWKSSKYRVSTLIVIAIYIFFFKHLTWITTLVAGVTQITFVLNQYYPILIGIGFALPASRGVDNSCDEVIRASKILRPRFHREWPHCHRHKFIFIRAKASKIGWTAWNSIICF